EPLRLPRGYSPDRGGAPVVANQNSALVTPKRDAKRQHVGYQVRYQVAVIRCQVGRRIAAAERGHCPPASLGQVWPDVAPGPRAVGIAVNEKRQWRARIAPRERAEPKPRGGNRQMLRRAHAPKILSLRAVAHGPPASARAASRGEGATRSSRAGSRGSHQFQRPNRETTAGTNSARMIVASRRIPAARPVASTLTSVSGPDASEMNARNRIRAALVTSLPVRAIPLITAVLVEPVASYSSRILARMNTS